MEPKLNIEYKISKENWLKGYDLYYSLFKKRSTYVKAAIFVVPLLLFVQQVFIDPSYTLGWICIVVCAAMIAATLITPKLERKNTANALDAISDDVYTLELYDDRFVVMTQVVEKIENLELDENGEPKPLPEIPASTCELSEKSLKCYETADVLGLFSHKGSFFIPKSELGEESLNILKDSLKSALGEKYREKI